MRFESLKSRANRRVVAAVAAGAAGLTALTGCGAELAEDQPATVVEHVDHPAYTSLICTKTCIPIIHPETFGLVLRQCGHEGDKYADEQGCIEDEVRVGRDTYEEVEDGDVVIPGASCHSTFVVYMGAVVEAAPIFLSNSGS